MFDVNALLSLLDKLSPLSLSDAMVARGDYDNSGLLVKCGDKAEKILFSLDLSDAAVARAIRRGCDTVVTHHPAIYSPIKRLNCDDLTCAPLLLAIKKSINVISMHLNLDIADGGIDSCLCYGLGAKNYKILDKVTEKNGYGREFDIDPVMLKDFVRNAKKVFATDKITVYGKKNAVIKKAASFCGGGSSVAEKCVSKKLTDAQLIVTSDMPHHVIESLIENGKCVMIMPHYVSEEYGFKKYYLNAAAEIRGRAETYYFDDKRFR